MATGHEVRVIPDVISELPPQDKDSGRTRDMEGGLRNGLPKSYGSTTTGTSAPIQEERKDSGYIHVYNSTAKDPILLEGKCDDQKKHSMKGCTCRCSTCGICYKTSLVVVLLLAILFCIGFTVSEVIPKSYGGKTFIYEDTIILIDKVDPFFYSTVTVEKINDREDHELSVYFQLCKTIIVEREVISLNATLDSSVNVMLFPQDALFLIEDSQLKMNYTVISSSTSFSDQGPSFVISDDMQTLSAFKHNSHITHSSKTFNTSITSKEVNAISYYFLSTGYYYLGFIPSGNTTVHIDYELSGYSYVRPNNDPSCVLRTASDSCSIKVPESILNSYGKDYCLFGEVLSNPYITEQVSVDIKYRVEHNGKWNIATISLLTSFLLLIFLASAMIAYWCVCHRAKIRYRSKYVAIQ